MHLYDHQGRPVYEVSYADPKKGMRKATLKDARKLNLLPSVTEVLRILDKPGLNVWKENQVFWAAKTSTQKEDETDKKYYSRVLKDSQEEARVKRDEGQTIHKAIETAFKGRIVDRQYKTLAFDVKAKIKAELLCNGLVSERSFGRAEYGYGGKVDLHCQGCCIVADIKTKEVLEPKKKLAWDEHIMQLAAYAVGLGLEPEKTTLVNIFVGWNGDVVFHRWDNPTEIARGWQMFRAALDLWKIQKRYNPAEGT